MLSENKIVPARGFRSETKPHHVFFGWDITYQCNYDCSYCSLGRSQEKKSKQVTAFLSPEEWSVVWRRIYEAYGSCEIHISGGEPFAYPGFMRIVSNLIEMHTFECSTNLSWDVEEFIQNVPPERARVGTSFHPEFEKYLKFFSKALALKNAGFEVWINCVAHPSFLSAVKEYKTIADRNDICFYILPFNGRFGDKEYPRDYSETETNFLNQLAEKSIVTKKSVDWALGGGKVRKQKLCRMGQMYAKIFPDGNAVRCCAKERHPLGNIIDGTFRLLEEPLVCASAECPCWRCMVVGEEERWGDHWVTPPALRNV